MSRANITAPLDGGRGSSLFAMEMVSSMFGPCHELKVFRSVVSLVMVDVMHDFVRSKRPAEHLFHHDAMFMSAVVLSIGFPLSTINLCRPILMSGASA